MARGDALFARSAVDWPQDARAAKLSDAGFRLNDALWRLAVKERSQTLPAHWDARAVQRWANLGTKVGQRLDTQWQLMSTLGLIRIEDDNRITVCGVKSCHPRLSWKDSPYGAHTGPVTCGHENKENKGENKRTADDDFQSTPEPDDPFFRAENRAEQRAASLKRDRHRKIAVELIDRFSKLIKYVEADEMTVDRMIDVIEDVGAAGAATAIERLAAEHTETEKKFKPGIRKGFTIERVRHLLKEPETVHNGIQPDKDIAPMSWLK